jgi:glycosyltransferase involved in cell wall biosynthesis
LAKAKLAYHARWLLYLGAPDIEPAPNVSIVIPIYNRAWLVDSLIENCLAQTYSPIEIVVVDDGSTDDTATRLGALADRIKLISQPNGGVSAARNAGLLAATGEFVHLLDSDNLLDEEHLEEKVRAFASIPDADLCYCKPTDVSLFGVRSPLRPGQAYWLSGGTVSPTIGLLDSFMADGYPFLVTGVTMPRFVFHQYGGFETDLCGGEDSRHWFRLALAGVKVIGITRRLFYRCRMADGLHEDRSKNDAVASLVCLRNVVDLLRKPEHWPLVAEYLAGHAGKRWNELLSRQASTYGADFGRLLETVADLPRVGQSSNRSPLALLLFMWMRDERVRAADATIDWTAASGGVLASALAAAIGRSAPLGQPDREDWLSRAMKLRAKPAFGKIVSVRLSPDLASEPKTSETKAFLRKVAGLTSHKETGSGVSRGGKKQKQPKATLVVPVHADPTIVEPTIVSCLEQSVVDRIEIILVENETARIAQWSERYPRARVIASPMADRVVEAHVAGLAAAKSKRLRFLLPGDILEPGSVERQIEASQEFDDRVAVVEVDGRRPRGLRDAVRLLTNPYRGRPEPVFSAILFPVSVLAEIGGFDVALGNEYQERYLFQLTAAGVSREFIEARSALRSGKPLTGSADQIFIAALANLIQCFGNPQLWPHIPAVAAPLSTLNTSSIGDDAQFHFLKIRTLEVTLKRIDELSLDSASCSPLVPFALCLIGLEGRSASVAQFVPQLETLRSAILKGVIDLPFDMSDELSMKRVLAETDDTRALAKSAGTVLAALDGRSRCAGLRELLQHMQSSVPNRSQWPRWRSLANGFR